MRGVSITIAAVLLTLVTIASAGLIYAWLGSTQNEIETKTSQSIIVPEVPPKISQTVCFTDYAYMMLINSQGQQIQARLGYVVEKGDTIVRTGYTNVSINETGRVYIPGLFDENLPYKLTLVSEHWSISDFCFAKIDPTARIYLAFDQGSGTIAQDSTDFNNDGTIAGAEWATGVSDSALYFDGASDYMDCGNDASLNFTDAITISVWVNQTNPVGWSKVIDRCVGSWGSTEKPWLIGINPSGSVYSSIHTTGGDGYANTYWGFTLENNTWYHLALTYEPVGGLKTYVNSVPQASMSAQGSINVSGSVNFEIGTSFNGTIDEVKVYRRALTDQEIELLYESMN